MDNSKKRILYTLIATMIIVFSTTFALLMTLERIEYRNYLQSQYSKNLYNMVNSVENIRSNLGKAVVIGSKEQRISVFNEIFRHASMADENLHSLPIPQITLNNTSKFLAQVGDFCYTLAKNNTQDVSLNDKQIELLDDLEMQAYSLEVELNRVLSDINKGKVKWGEIRKKTSTVLAKENNNIENKFKVIQKQISEYPVLIYDGPFSDKTLNIEPKVLSEKEVSQNEAKNELYKVYGKNNIDKIETIENNKDKKVKIKIPTYRFNIQLKNSKQGESIVSEVSKNGGHIVYLMYNKTKGKATISKEQAEKIGSVKLEQMGYQNMKTAYKLVYDDYILINYVYKQNNITMYPDQIKLKISLIDGSITGIESDKYLVSHVKNRTMIQPKINSEKGKARVSKRLKITSTNLVVVPNKNSKEVLCYEYLGSYKDKKFIIYINAETGYEEEIVEIINTPNGELTI